MFEDSMAAAAAADGGPAKGAEGKRAGGESLGDGVPTSKDLIDFGRPMELRTLQGPRSESSNARQEDSVRRSKSLPPLAALSLPGVLAYQEAATVQDLRDAVRSDRWWSCLSSKLS